MEQSHINESLGTIPTIVSDSIQKKAESLRSLIIVVLATIFGMGCILLYTKWQTVPVKKHMFLVVPIKSDKKYDFKIDFSYVDNNGYYSYEEMYSYWNTDEKGVLKSKDGARITPTAKKMTSPTKNNVSSNNTEKTLSNILNKGIYNELIDSCEAHGIYIEDSCNVFAICHLSNESLPNFKHKIEFGGNNTVLAGCNDTLLDGYWIKEEMKNEYSSISQSIVFPPQKNYIDVNIGLGVTEKKYKWNKIFQLEDISKAYYKIVTKSPYKNTVTMNFVSDIRVHATENVLSELKNNPINSVTISNELLYNQTHQFFVNYSEMENLQTMRLFFLAAFITLCISAVIKNALNLLLPWILSYHKQRKNNSIQIDEEWDDEESFPILLESGKKNDENVDCHLLEGEDDKTGNL
jgi:hypothetical protein